MFHNTNDHDKEIPLSQISDEDTAIIFADDLGPVFVPMKRFCAYDNFMTRELADLVFSQRLLVRIQKGCHHAHAWFKATPEDPE